MVIIIHLSAAPFGEFPDSCGLLVLWNLLISGWWWPSLPSSTYLKLRTLWWETLEFFTRTHVNRTNGGAPRKYFVSIMVKVLSGKAQKSILFDKTPRKWHCDICNKCIYPLINPVPSRKYNKKCLLSIATIHDWKNASPLSTRLPRTPLLEFTPYLAMPKPGSE